MFPDLSNSNIKVSVHDGLSMYLHI